MIDKLLIANGGEIAIRIACTANELNIATVAAGREAIHPGYGLLSDNAGLAQVSADNDLVFIGLGVETQKNFGDNITARRRPPTWKQ